MTIEHQAKQIGMDFAALKNSRILEIFRTLARECRKDTVDIDDVRMMAEKERILYSPGNWLGSVFTSKEWRWTGEVRASSHPGSHGRMIKVWRHR